MTNKEVTHGLGCPRCGGIIPIPEGQIIITCPYCELRSAVKGEHGNLRYQVPIRTNRAEAEKASKKFLNNMAIARDARRKAEIEEIFLVHLPFWGGWGNVMGWVFGQKKERHGEHTTYKPKEVNLAEEMNWSQAACDVGEFGVQRIRLTGLPLDPFDPETLHNTGMVFEPVGSAQEAMGNARNDFENRIRKRSKLDKISQVISHVLNPRLAIVYHPLWVIRYLYHGRAFQIAVDGHSGEVLYGKAPGNNLYRSAVLVGGMLVGAILAVDIPAAIILLFEDSDIIAGALVAFIIGIGLMFTAYRKFRYGEHYVYLRDKPEKGGADSMLGSLGPLKEIKEITDALDIKIDLP